MFMGRLGSGNLEREGAADKGSRLLLLLLPLLAVRDGDRDVLGGRVNDSRASDDRRRLEARAGGEEDCSGAGVSVTSE